MYPYEYGPIVSDQEIRLLHLLPGRHLDDIEIEIHSVTFTTLKPPVYEALSYAWGTTANRRIIKVRPRSGREGLGTKSPIRPYLSRNEDSSTLAVTQNLEIALRYLRLPEKRRIFWIDAICINQEDMPERSCEVGRMGRIFSSATQVVVWLGPESGDSTLAMETMQRFGEDVSYDGAKLKLWVKAGTGTFLLHDDEQAIRAKQANWIAVRNVWERDWFKRLWVIQEIQLAARAILTLGHFTMPWPSFYTAFRWIRSSIRPRVDAFDGLDFGHLAYVIEAKMVPNIITITNATNRSLCLDPRDRVYAILGLLEKDHSMGIVPNYQLSPEEIFEDFTLRHIRFTGTLEILRLCTMRGEGSLSWVPDMANLLGYKIPLLFNACGAPRHKFYPPINSRLSIQGVNLSTIGYLSSKVPPSAKLPEILSICRTWDSNIVISALYQSGGTMLDAYLSTLAGGQTRESSGITVGVAPSFEDCRSFFYNCIRGQQTTGLSLRQVEYCIGLVYSLPGRSIFITTDGNFGLGPEEARNGDYICIIFGCTTPLILRPVTGHDGHYRLVGECYVHSLMHSEGLLGPIPSSWDRKLISVTQSAVTIWQHATKGITHEDPRLEPLPSEWRRVYRDADGNLTDLPFDIITGAPNYPLFKEIKTGVTTWADPRLGVEAAKDRGVNVKELILV